MSVGRNEPCPCGSGRKYKRCCQSESRPEPSTGEQRMRAGERLFEELWDFARKELGGARLALASESFGLPEGEEGELEVAQLFAPWICYHWIPEFERDEEPPEGWEAGSTVAENYLIRHERRLSEAERLYIERAVPEPLSAWELLSTEGDRLRFRDRIRDVERELVSPEAAAVLEVGEVLVAGLIEAEDGEVSFCGVATQPLSPAALPALEALKSKLVQAGGDHVDDLLAAHSFELVELLRVAEGESPRLHHLRYEVPSAAKAFESLEELGSPDWEPELVRNEEGEIREAEWAWQEPAEDGAPRSVAGFQLRGAQLDVLCETEGDVERVRAEIGARLPEASEIDHRVTEADELP